MSELLRRKPAAEMKDGAEVLNVPLPFTTTEHPTTYYAADPRRKYEFRDLIRCGSISRILLNGVVFFVSD
jgi:hypothetical protein